MAKKLSKIDYTSALQYALSNTDIQHILLKVTGMKTNIVTYPELQNVVDITPYFDRLGRLVVFIPISTSFGHWCCITKRENGKVYEWFDPYGVKPDGEKKFISKQTLDRLHEEKPYLTKLLKREQDQGAIIKYNPYHWQSNKANTDDCGRWVCARLIYNKLSLDEINDMIKQSGLKPDEWVVNLTYPILGK